MQRAKPKTKVIRKTYKLRVYPSYQQKVFLQHWFGSSRWIYNKTLEYKNKAYKRRKESVSKKKTSEFITHLKKHKNFIFINSNFKDIHGCNFVTYSISSQQYKLASALIDNGADVNLEDYLNQLPLMYVFMKLLQGEDCYNLIDIIIDRMDNINKRIIFDQTSLFFLFDIEHNKNVKYNERFRKLIVNLIKKGADFNLKNKANETIWDISKREN